MKFQILSCALVPLLLSTIQADTTITLHNPDGSLATDARVVSINALGLVLDEKFQLVPGKTAPAQNSISHPECIGGKVAFEIAPQCWMASSSQGFIFSTRLSDTQPIKLRPWSSLKLETSSMPAAFRNLYQIKIVWQNNFTGSAPKLPHAKEKLDWRFDRLVQWNCVVEVRDQILNVPPGEVQIFVQAKTQDQRAIGSQIEIGYCRTLSGQQATFAFPQFGSAKGSLQTMPDFPNWATEVETLRCVAVTLPKASLSTAKLRELLGKGKNLDDPFGGNLEDPLSDSSILRDSMADQLAAYYASAEGTELRHQSMSRGIESSIIDANGHFEFPLLPVGNFSVIAARTYCVTASNGKQLVLTVKPQQTTDLGNIGRGNAVAPMAGPDKYLVQLDDPPVADFSRPKPQISEGSSEVLYEEVQRLTAERNIERSTVPLRIVKNSITASQRQSKIREALARTSEDSLVLESVPLKRVLESLEDEFHVPIVVHSRKLQERGVDLNASVNLRSPPITLGSILNLVLTEISDDLTYTVRDEVLVITTRSDAAHGPDSQQVALMQNAGGELLANKPVAGHSESERLGETVKQFVDELRSSNQGKLDQAELRRLARQKLESEFDNMQAARRAEIKRLEELLRQSKEWIDARDAGRNQIIDKKLSELLP